MVMYEAGMLARSKAGHDKAQMYIIKEVDDTYVYLVDGRIRTLDEAGIRVLIKDWMKEEK